MKINNNLISDNFMADKSWLHRLDVGEEIDAYFTSRGMDADASNPYSGFNVCHYSGDDLSHVADCRRLLCETMGIAEDSLIVPRQTHSSKVLLIDSLPVSDGQLEDVDGIVTTLKDIVIGVSTADCVPVVLSDIKSGVVGVAHAGWRGTVNGIIENIVDTMVSAGAKTDGIKVAMGPSICSECFEVGEEVASVFPNSCVGRRINWEKPHVNLHNYIREKLIHLGLAERNIKQFDNRLCTKCHPLEFFSARVLGVKSGRIFTFIKR